MVVVVFQDDVIGRDPPRGRLLAFFGYDRYQHVGKGRLAAHGADLLGASSRCILKSRYSTGNGGRDPSRKEPPNWTPVQTLTARRSRLHGCLKCGLSTQAAAS